MVLLIIDGYLRDIEYDFTFIENEGNIKLCKALQYVFDPFENSEIKEAIIDIYGNLKKESLREYFDPSIKCLIRISESVEFWKLKGIECYFDFIYNDFYHSGFENEPFDYTVFIGQEKQ